jgi:hypothetical protein
VKTTRVKTKDNMIWGHLKWHGVDIQSHLLPMTSNMMRCCRIQWTNSQDGRCRILQVAFLKMALGQSWTVPDASRCLQFFSETFGFVLCDSCSKRSTLDFHFHSVRPLRFESSHGKHLRHRLRPKSLAESAKFECPRVCNPDILDYIAMLCRSLPSVTKIHADT